MPLSTAKCNDSVRMVGKPYLIWLRQSCSSLTQNPDYPVPFVSETDRFQ